MNLSRTRGLVLFSAISVFTHCGSDSVSPATRDLVREVHLRMLTLDAHVEAARPGRASAGTAAFDLKAMEKGGLDAAVIFVTAPPLTSPPKPRPALDAALERIASIISPVEKRPERAGIGLSPADAYKFEKLGRRTVYLGLTYGDALGTDVSFLAVLHARGVRFLKLCGETDNAISASPLDGTKVTDLGLSAFGRNVVAECNRLGVVIDVGGCSPRSTADVLAASRAPVLCSGSAAQALCDAPGNLSDGTVRAIAAAGGVIMVPFVPHRLVPAGSARRAGVADIVAHILHLADAAGAEAVGLGSYFGDGGGVPGCADASEVMSVTFEALRRGLDEHSAEGVWGGNVMRVFERAMGAAAAR